MSKPLKQQIDTALEALRQITGILSLTRDNLTDTDDVSAECDQIDAVVRDKLEITLLHLKATLVKLAKPLWDHLPESVQQLCHDLEGDPE